LKVAFDSWALASRLRHQGTYVYTRNLIAQFGKIAERSPETAFCLFSSPRAANDTNRFARASGLEPTRSDLLACDRLWRLGGVAIAAARVGANLIFSPTSNILPVGPIPVVCTIHDVIPVKMRVPRRVTLLLHSLLWASARFSRAIITDSQCSKKDLIETYRLPDSKVSVVHLGYDSEIFNDNAGDSSKEQSLLETLGIRRPYIFHHGVIQPRKNLIRLIQAYRMILSRNPNLDLALVLAGRLGWEYDDIVATARGDETTPGEVILTGALPDADLAVLLKKASLVAIPSLYEGFCLPMVEAMAAGAPTVAANSSCLPEISGGILHYFNPLSVEDMADCMERLLENQEAREDLARRGKARSAYFSWQRCAEETLQVLRNNCES
jgi:glycosyltransferase involved in cell wall biosynthesis